MDHKCHDLVQLLSGLTKADQFNSSGQINTLTKIIYIYIFLYNYIMYIYVFSYVFYIFIFNDLYFNYLPKTSENKPPISPTIFFQ